MTMESIGVPGRPVTRSASRALPCTGKVLSGHFALDGGAHYDGTNPCQSLLCAVPLFLSTTAGF